MVFDNVKKVYRTEFYEVKALDGINLEIEKGEFLTIMGPSGSGKSTMLNLIGCLDKPTEGEIYINGVATSRLSDDELTDLRRDTIGFVFQQFNLIPTLTARENVELPMIFRGISEQERGERAMELLKLVGIEKEAERKPVEMSGGQQQRVAIARALANNPEILLCDEPTGNLDSKTGKQVMEILRVLNEEGVTVVLVTHDESLKGYADRVVRLRDGRIINVSSAGN
ncbi:ABC transporter involved in export of lipoprotein and macrolide, ATP-binding component [Geoglobus acetivorans]|uniref:ABC transporter involved in export of lipoprotein and macrolide, ATP-binding component n=1 Tax=Geoglobus acetivorans TaxID=565033 RepID=A0A0A7GJE7_GEOAI|nr:ABC transporter involved in export of lipoprotein and macrolide, ATP-binding component [Geoglobus acetivorans]